MSHDRPNPDELLARVRAEEARAGRGRLRVFFGYAAGVGKTFAMLEAARREKAAGTDVVVGYVEPHGRPATEAMLDGLEVLPTRSVPYEGVTLREFDLDAALARKPRLLLVDELAHTNAAGSRHTKRWQDVEELLAAGIDVWTTLNVQHLESLNDVVAQITGVVVRETLPDAVIDRADEIELIDITPDELAARLRAGHVYVPLQAERALASFFQKSNLVALRELSLREAADRLNKDVEAARRERATGAPWATRDRLLVCVGPSPTSAKLIRTAKRMADALDAEWLAVAVQTHESPAGDPVRERVARHLALAERLGAETQTLVGGNVAATLLEHARRRNVTKIVVGKTARPWWKRLLRRGLVDELLDQSGDIDVYVIRGKAEGPAPVPPAQPIAPVPWPHYLATAAVVAACGLLGWVSETFRLTEANTVMVFLLGVVFVAHRYGRGPAVVAAIANVLVFDFFFVPPFLTFTVNDAQYLITFAVMLIVGLLVSMLTVRVRERLEAVQRQERRTAALYRLTQQLSGVVGTVFLVQIAGRQLREIFGGEAVVFVRQPGDPVELRFGQGTEVAKVPVNAVVAQWVADHDQVAGLGTDTLPNATALFVPLTGSQRTVGAIGVRPDDPQRFLDPEQRRLLETCASLVALAVERDQSVLEAQQAKLKAEAEQLRNSLLSSVSHDLRTPLAAMAGAASSLLDHSPDEPAERRDLLQTIVDESRRLARLVDNLLDMTRIEAGAVVPNRQWHVLEEIVGSAVHRVTCELGDRPIHTDLPPELPLVSVDGLLVEQVLVNLLENAARYTPAGSPIEIAARQVSRSVEIRVADRGPGLPLGDEKRVFEKFYRGSAARPDGRRGVGLGLAIAHGIVEAHGGRITARNRPGGGAEFVITLPTGGPAPAVPTDGVPIGASA
jgi:two-component system sensor histidine kinase KdpD